MKYIPAFPNFEPISSYMHDELHPFLNNLLGGISEFTFLSLLMHQKKYNYEISALGNKVYALTGKDKEGFFFTVVGGCPGKSNALQLIEKFKRWKNISEDVCESCKEVFASLGFELIDDRDNADYLYFREKLASLAGKSLHKKRNLANNFEKTYNCEVRPLDITTAADAGDVLDEWQMTRPEGLASDYEQCFSALSLLAFTEQYGWIVYANGKPVGWALGEYIASGNMFVVHFEKGLDEYKGVYQFVNRATAQNLPETVTYINREQDLGDEGLRQAKMTYRPAGFVNKYQFKIV